MPHLKVEVKSALGRHPSCLTRFFNPYVTNVIQGFFLLKTLYNQLKIFIACTSYLQNFGKFIEYSYNQSNRIPLYCPECSGSATK